MSSKHIRALSAQQSLPHSLTHVEDSSPSECESEEEEDIGKSAFLALDSDSDSDSECDSECASECGSEERDEKKSVSECVSERVNSSSPISDEGSGSGSGNSDGSSDSSSDSSSDGSRDVIATRVVPKHTQISLQKKSKSSTHSSTHSLDTTTTTTITSENKKDEDMEYLDSLLLHTTSRVVTTTSNNRYQFLSSDRHTLDIDAVMRRRFGGSSLHAHSHTHADDDDTTMDNIHANQHNGNGKKKNKNNRNQRILTNQMKKSVMLNKRLLFGFPKEDWPRPLSYINGGFCMNQVNRKSSTGVIEGNSTYKRFEFQWSFEYQQVHEEFLRVQSTGDANQLCLFISRHPHHMEALLQLAMVFARTGQMDRAADLVRRCLYYIEQVHVEQFKPYEHPCLLDITQQENKIYYLALFRHMQISGMLGCPKVASSIGKYILSLDPAGDPVHTLLFLDHYFLTSGNHTEVAVFCSTSAGSVLLQENSVGSDMVNNDDGVKLAEESIFVPSHIISDVLPNWSLSLSLSLFLSEVDSGTGHLKPKSANVLSPSVTTLSPSQIALHKACHQFPFMIPLSLSSAMADDKTRRNWKVILEHPYFEAFSTQDRLSKLVGEANAKVLVFLSKLHKIKSVDCGSSSIWKRNDVLTWLYNTLQCFIESLPVEDAIDEPIGNSIRLMTNNCKSSDLDEKTSGNRLLFRYLTANDEDFLDEYPRLPPEANPLDPRFTDPRVLAGNVVPDMGGAGGMFGLGGGNFDEGAMWQMQGIQRPTRRGNLDPRLPMMQLFLATIFPWNELDLNGT